MKGVASDQREESRKEGAARRACPLRNHACELPDLNAQKRRSKNKGRGHRAIEPGPATCPGPDACEAAGEARDEKASRLEPDVAQVEQLPAGWSPCRVAGQHRIGGEEGGEHDDVAQQENPEAVAGDDALRNRSPGRVPLRVLAIRRLPVVPEVMRVIEAAGRID